MQRWGNAVWPANGSGFDAAQVLIDCREKSELSGAEQDRLFHRLRKGFEEQKDDKARFELVCLAVQPKRTVQDLVYARGLLRDYLGRKPSREDLAALAATLESMIDQRLVVEQRLVEERARAETLAGKLKALEDIEKIIQKREEGALPR
jgi:hypothetical protein